MHPFDLKSALLARHAQHVVLVHFPIALFLAGVGFDFFGQWKRKRTLAAVAYYDLLVAAISSLPVMATGVLAWRWQLEGQRLKGMLLLHLVMGLVASTLIWWVWSIHFRARRNPGGKLPLYRLPDRGCGRCRGRRDRPSRGISEWRQWSELNEIPDTAGHDLIDRHWPCTIEFHRLDRRLQLTLLSDAFLVATLDIPN